jgi:hypothetical protein
MGMCCQSRKSRKSLNFDPSEQRDTWRLEANKLPPIKSRRRMSEYQYYEFQTADRRLSEKETQELRSYSTRAVITPTSFSNEYSFGSFKGDPNVWMEKYFDGYVYLANWGTHELQLALPAKLLSGETAGLYCGGDGASVRERTGKVILTLRSDEEPGGEWVQGEGLLSSLLPLRVELAQGDLRALYVGWLLNVQNGELDEQEIEPPVPPNLNGLSGPLSNLVDYLRIDQDLLAVASQVSALQPTLPVQRKDMAVWVAQLSAQEKDNLLVQLMTGEELAIGAELRSRFNRSRSQSGPLPGVPRRTVGQLLAAAKAFKGQREREEARQSAEAKAREQRSAALARQKHLDSLVGQESDLWTKVEELVATKLPKSYDLAVQHLMDLRDLAVRKGFEPHFSQRLALLREAHSRKKHTFIKLLQEKGL